MTGELEHSAHYESPARDAAVHVVRTLRDAGYEALFAGGCVRDERLGKQPKDYDVATDATPDHRLAQGQNAAAR